MADQTETVYLAVRGRVLWVGSEAYPLHNIARATTRVIRPDVGRARGTLFTRALVIVLLSLVAGAVAEDDTGNVAGTVALVGVATVVLLFVIEVAQPTRHGLTIETTGPPYALIVVRHAEPLAELVARIAQAIDNPAAEFEMRILDVQIGDRIAQYGDRNSIHKR